MGQRNRDATAASPEIRGAAHGGRLDPRRKARLYEFGERRTGHEDTFIHVKLVAREPRLVDEVGHRHAFANSTICEFIEVLSRVLADLSRIGARHVIVREAESREDQPGGLVERVIGAVTIAEIGILEPAGELADELFDGKRRVCGVLHAGRGHEFSQCVGESITLDRQLPVELPPPSSIRETNMAPKNFLIAIILAIALSAGIFLAVRINQPSVPKTALVLPAPAPLPEFSLLDQTGATVTADTFKGQWDLVFFGFTHCPDICPATMQILASARKALAESDHQPMPRIVLVSVDPERDTPELMGRYVDYFGNDNLGVTGDLDELVKLTSALGIYFEKQTGDGENYAVDHSAAVLVVNPDGAFHALFGGPHLVENYVHDLPLIMDSFIAAPLPPLVASDVVVTRPVPGANMSAGYLSLTNNTDETVRITRVASPEFGSAEFHESTIEDGVARMREIPALGIPAHGTVTLERGGKHLMLMQPGGVAETITLHFFDGDRLLLTVAASYTPE